MIVPDLAPEVLTQFLHAKLSGVPGEAQLKKEAKLPSRFSTVVCQGGCGRGLLETSKLKIFEANCGLASVARGILSL